MRDEEEELKKNMPHFNGSILVITWGSNLFLKIKYTEETEKGSV